MSSVLAGFKFFQYHWNRLEKGSTVVVTLSTAANVRLMDSTNFSAYKNGRNHRYTGGLVRKTPFRIAVPRTGSWYLTIDLVGLKATTVRHSATVEPPPLSTAKSPRRSRPSSYAGWSGDGSKPRHRAARRTTDRAANDAGVTPTRLPRSAPRPAAREFR